jgi:hypothetical protein
MKKALTFFCVWKIVILFKEFEIYWYDISTTYQLYLWIS